MIGVILVIGLALRLISLNQSLWLDEAINIMAAKHFSLFGMVTQYAAADFHPPGWFVIIWFLGKFFGYSEVVMRLPSVIFGVLAVFVTYLIGKKLISKNIGLLAALLLSVNPLHIYYSQDARMYSLATLAVTVNIFLLIKIIKKEKVNLILLVVSNLFILLSDYLAYFIFPAEFIILKVLKQKGIFKKWFIALSLTTILSSLWVPVFLNQLNVGAVASANLPTWKFIVGSFDLKTVPLTFVKFIIGRIGLADKVFYYAILLPISILFLYLIWQGGKKLDNLQKKLLLTWVVIPPLIATAISLVVPVYNYFRMLFILPGFLILVVSGILSFKNKLRISFLTAVVLIEISCSLIYLLNPSYQREDWRGLVSYFKNLNPQVILFESSGTLPPFDYYAADSLNARGALRDFPAKDEGDVSDLEISLKDYKEVYLVDYLVQISDPQRLVAKKLTNLGYKQADIKNFNGVGFVYYFIK